MSFIWKVKASVGTMYTEEVSYIYTHSCNTIDCEKKNFGDSPETDEKHYNEIIRRIKFTCHSYLYLSMEPQNHFI